MVRHLLIAGVVISIFFSLSGIAAEASTTISCSSDIDVGQTVFHSQFSFSYSPINLVVTNSVNGKQLASYVFLNATTACGQPLSAGETCQTSEVGNAIQAGHYDFEFSCTDGRRGEMHYDSSGVMAYCYRSTGDLDNQKGGTHCTISN